jgi:hypothetical protein
MKRIFAAIASLFQSSSPPSCLVCQNKEGLWYVKMPYQPPTTGRTHCTMGGAKLEATNLGFTKIIV